MIIAFFACNEDLATSEEAALAPIVATTANGIAEQIPVLATDKNLNADLVFKRLRAELQGLKLRLDKEDRLNNRLRIQFRQSIDQTLGNFNFIDSLRQQSTKIRAIPHLYLLDLDEDANDVELLRTYDDDWTPRQLNTLRFVQVDSEIKREFGESSPMAPCDTVRVTVITKLNGKAKGPFKVFCIPARYTLEEFKKGKGKIRKRAFDQDSDEETGMTSGPLTPTLFNVWTQSLNEKMVEGPEQTMEVKKRGDNKFDIIARN